MKNGPDSGQRFELAGRSRPRLDIIIMWFDPQELGRRELRLPARGSPRLCRPIDRLQARREAILAKRRDWPYRSARTPDWIKIKNPSAPAVTRIMEW